ncbi:hypothetical protein KCU85_g162, partial [Aureobasidium melanogenum]
MLSVPPISILLRDSQRTYQHFPLNKLCKKFSFCTLAASVVRSRRGVQNSRNFAVAPDLLVLRCRWRKDRNSMIGKMSLKLAFLILRVVAMQSVVSLLSRKEKSAAEQVRTSKQRTPLETDVKP